jgi:serine/threonine protein kinase
MGEAENLLERIQKLTGWASVTQPAIVEDTSDWTRIQRGDLLRLGGRDFLVKGNQHETRFGIEDQPKYWVFNAVDMITGEQKIIKTVFHEDFHVHVGVFKIHCYRSPEKEARVLDITSGDTRFMRGYTVSDKKGNQVRVIDFIKGYSLFWHVHNIKKSHAQYFNEDLPGILHKIAGSIEAIGFLHKHGTCHGDIRNDHIIVEENTGIYKWIDFDLNQNVSDYDVWSIGNIINYAVGKGITSFQQIIQKSDFPDSVKSSLCSDDASAFFEYRIMNLKKLYPYIPPMLSDILLHFTRKPRAFYASIDQLMEEYRQMLDSEFA